MSANGQGGCRDRLGSLQTSSCILPIINMSRTGRFKNDLFSNAMVTCQLAHCQSKTHTTVEVVELWTVFHEHYSLLGQSSIMGRCISTDHRFAYKDCSVCRSSHFYEAVYFCRFEIRMGISMLSHFSFIFH